MYEDAFGRVCTSIYLHYIDEQPESLNKFILNMKTAITVYPL